MISLLKLRKRLIILNVRQRGRKSLTKFQLVFANLRLILQSVSLLYSICKEMSIVLEKMSSLRNDYKLELSELNDQLKNAEQLISDNQVSLEDFTSKISQKENEKLFVISDLDRLKSNLEERRQLLKSQQELLLEKVREIANKENEISSLDKLVEGKVNLSDKLNHKIQTLTGNIAKTVGYIEELEQEKSDANLKFQEAEAVYNQKQREKEELEHQLNSLKGKELEERSLLNGIKDRIHFIQTLIDNLEGVSKGAKALLENNKWNNGDKSLLAHIGNTSENYRIAVEASLKNNLNTILFDSIDDLQKGIDFLKRNDIEKAAFYVAKKHSSHKRIFSQWVKYLFFKRKIKSLEKENGFVAWAKNLIQTEDKWKIFFEKYLDKTVIVNSIDNELKLSRKYNEFNFVTVDGDIIDQYGIVEGGSIPKLDDSVFGRKQLLQNLKADFSKREKELVSFKQKIDRTESNLSLIDLKILSEQGRMLQNDIANIEKKISQFEFERKKANDEIEKAREEIRDIAFELS